MLINFQAADSVEAAVADLEVDLAEVLEEVVVSGEAAAAAEVRCSYNYLQFNVTWKHIILK